MPKATQAQLGRYRNGDPICLKTNGLDLTLCKGSTNIGAISHQCLHGMVNTALTDLDDPLLLKYWLITTLLGEEFADEWGKNNGVDTT